MPLDPAMDDVFEMEVGKLAAAIGWSSQHMMMESPHRRRLAGGEMAETLRRSRHSGAREQAFRERWGGCERLDPRLSSSMSLRDEGVRIEYDLAVLGAIKLPGYEDPDRTLLL